MDKNMLTVQCNSCGNNLEVPKKYAGMTGKCKFCGASISVPELYDLEIREKIIALTKEHLPPPPLPPEIVKKDYQECPFCYENIKLNAIKCKHCGEFLDGIGPNITTSIATPIQLPKNLPGQPVCLHCGGTNFKKGNKAVAEGSGCIIVLIGILLTPFIIGIFVILYGLILMFKTEGYWTCKQCGVQVKRTLKWYEF
jgi:ribosomal protein L37AE/L43A